MTPEQREAYRTIAQKHKAEGKNFVIIGPDAILSLIAQVEALTVPQGWKCAPMNPVVEQVSAGQKADWNAHHVTKIYQEMLEAAPTIPAILGTKEGE